MYRIPTHSEHSIKKHLQNESLPIPVLPVEMSRLANAEEIDYQSFALASSSLLTNIAKMRERMDSKTAMWASSMTAYELESLIKEALAPGGPRGTINSPSKIQKALKERIAINNQRTEKVDKETFWDFIKRDDRIPIDLKNAPEYQQTLKAFKNGSWQDGEEKEITFTNFDDKDLEKWNAILESFFKNSSVRAVLPKFIDLCKSDREKKE
jgi:hypothetical protein